MESALRFITVFLIFLLVVFISHLTTKIVGNYQKNQLSGGNIKLLDAARLNSNSYIQIVRVANRILVLAVSKESVSTLCELSEDEYKSIEEDANNVSSNSAFLNFLETAKKTYSQKKN